MVLKYPHPFKSWFTIANDPDNTLIKDWHELNDFIWKELALPITNSLFIKSFNHNLPEQVNLVDNPEILSQEHDIIHTWGDYMHARELGFDRKHAEEAVEILKENNIEPKVWIDHSDFIGNVLHSSNKGGVPNKVDASGNLYENFVYSLDLIKGVGISYVWDGDVVDIVGQDRELGRLEYFKSKSRSNLIAYLRTIFSFLIKHNSIKSFLGLKIPFNKQFYIKKFPDGNKMYAFKRYGTWKDADIYGLGKVTSRNKIDDLLKKESTMVVYTHLGKRPTDKLNEDFHIPNSTKSSLTYVRDKFLKKELMVSPLSELFDYLVIRDNLNFNLKDNLIEINPDGIRFEEVGQNDVKGMKLSFYNLDGKFELKSLKVKSGKEDLTFEIIIEDNPDIFSIKFT